MNKFLKVMLGLLGLTGLLIIIFLAVGLIAGTLHYENEVVIDAPVDKTWNLFTDTSLTKEWLPGYQGMELLEGDLNEAGSRYKVTLIDQGRRIEMTEQLDKVVPEEAFHFTLEGEVMTSRVQVSMSPAEGEKTRLVAKSEVRGHSLFYRSLFALMKGTFRKNDKQVYDRFKAMVEGHDPAGEMKPSTREKENTDTIQ